MIHKTSSALTFFLLKITHTFFRNHNRHRLRRVTWRKTIIITTPKDKQKSLQGFPTMPGYFLICTLTWLMVGVELSQEQQTGESLYTGNDVNALLHLCDGVQVQEVMNESDGSGTGIFKCTPDEDCIPKCNEKRLETLHEAQNKTREMLDNLNDVYNALVQIILFSIVVFEGVYLIFQKHFDWKNLPLIGYPFASDPTDGYRYSHLIWMKWVILDSDNPNYYKGMTSDTKEVEYLPQRLRWEDPEAGSDEDLHPAWSIRDIYDMTADPEERLEFYFRRIQQRQQVTKQGRGDFIKKFKKNKQR